jgi:hypothetical protein
MPSHTVLVQLLHPLLDLTLDHTATRRCSCMTPSRPNVRSRHAAAYRRQLAQLAWLQPASGAARRASKLHASESADARQSA